MENKGNKKKKQQKNDTQLSFGFMDSKPEIKLLTAKKTKNVAVIVPNAKFKKVD